jgi:anti-sigma factor RsiW
MSSKHNDTIHLGNYEEYFILYMDGELSAEETADVERFLEAHPDLRSELDLLMSTKLPMTEETGFDKSFLIADQMKLDSLGEDLLLFVDGELPQAEAALVASRIENEPEMARQHALLLQTRLDAQETIPYPNKEELYRRTERVVFFRPWMRAAAAVLLIGSMGLFWFSRNEASPVTTGGELATNTGKAQTAEATKPAVTGPAGQPQTLALQPSNGAEKKLTRKALPSRSTVPVRQDEKERNLVARFNPAPEAGNTTAAVGEQIRTIDAGRMVEGTVAQAGNTLTQPVINNSSVTNLFNARTTDSNPPVNTAASKDRNAKGKVKGFLRKATTIFEKRTGIDPTDEDGKLLIGALAVKLD